MSEDTDCTNGTTVTLTFDQYKAMTLRGVNHALRGMNKALDHLDEYYRYDTQSDVDAAYELIMELVGGEEGRQEWRDQQTGGKTQSAAPVMPQAVAADRLQRGHRAQVGEGLRLSFLSRLILLVRGAWRRT